VAVLGLTSTLWLATMWPAPSSRHYCSGIVPA
jgi:hypothetical protein